jgi:hypothetical protein
MCKLTRSEKRKKFVHQRPATLRTSISEASFALNGGLETAGIRSTIEMGVAMIVQGIPDMIQTACEDQDRGGFLIRDFYKPG